MVQVDPVLVAIAVGLVAFVFFVYLMVRRTLLGFKEGVRDAEDR
ncbi:MAG: hypothetical protein ABEI96_09165 [Haloarculaceae archaeon]